MTAPIRSAVLPQSIAEVLTANAATVGDRPAVVWPFEDLLVELTYAELLDDATALSSRLRAACGPGDRVAVWAANSADWLVLEYAVALAGLTLVPLNPSLSDREVEFQLRAAEVRLLFCGEAFRGRELRSRAERLQPGLPALREVRSLSEWRELPVADTEAAIEIDPDADFLVQFTSGTTGRPKGAVLSQRAAIGAAASSVGRLGPGEHEVWCSPMPMHHVGGSISMALGLLCTGGTLVLLPGFDAAETIELIERTRATLLGAVPTMLIDILDHPVRTHHDLSSLRVLQIGGSTVPPSLISRARDTLRADVVNAYGQSEAPNLAQTSLAASAHVVAESIGTPNPQREVRVVDPITQQPAATGELWIRTSLRMSRYLDEPELTAAVLTDDGWLRTGDLVTEDADGVLCVVGRLRDVIIRGGENIYPAEVEDVLVQHPAVADAAVVGSPHERWGEEPVAFLRLRDQHQFDSEDLAEFCRGRLASFKVPRRWVVTEEFPLTPSGKVKRFELQRRLRERVESGRTT